MPVRVRKVRGGYQVRDAGRVKARHTSRGKARRQANLLRAVAHGWHPRRRR